MTTIKYVLVTLFMFTFLLSCGNVGLDTGGTSSNNNTGSETTLSGSYATILEVGDFLYAVNREQLVTFRKTTAGLDEVDKQDVGFRIENIYHYAGVLFIGSEGSLYIYAIGTNGIPVRKSETQYDNFNIDVRPCDPVIARGDIAYVTLSTSTQGPCGRSIQVNELRTYDVSDIETPVLLTETAMINPKGLGFKDDYLLVCEGNAGVKIFDITDKRASPELINHLEGFQAIDLIVNGNKLLVVGQSEIRQFDISNIHAVHAYGSYQI